LGFRTTELSDVNKEEILTQIRSNSNQIISILMDRNEWTLTGSNEIYHHIFVDEAGEYAIEQVANQEELNKLFDDLKELILNLRGTIANCEIVACVNILSSSLRTQYMFYAPIDNENCYCIERDYEICS
jgi:hypothetical protein